MKQLGSPVIFFDGVCNLCNSSVQFIIKKDAKAVFKFASLQSDFALETLATYSVSTRNLDSIVLLDSGKVYFRSTAALRIVRHLPYWRFLYFLIIVPTPLRDWIYNLVAQNRYRWFGKKDACMIPSPELNQRFIS